MPDKTKKILLSTLVIALIGTGIWSLNRPAPGKTAGGTAVPVRVVQVLQQDVPRYINGIGAVLSLHSVIIRPQIDGILTEIRVKEGQTVKAGDLRGRRPAWPIWPAATAAVRCGCSWTGTGRNRRPPGGGGDCFA